MSSVIRKIMHKIAFFATLCGHQEQHALYLKVVTQKDCVAEFYRENASFTRKTAN